MLAIPTPGGLSPIAMAKVCKLAAGLGAQLEVFHCIYDAEVGRPGRFASRGPQADIREFIEHRRRQLELIAGQLRSRGISVRTSVRWDHPVHEGIVRQVLRHEPDLLIAGATERGHTGLLLTRTDFKLIETCPCPVLFMKSRTPYADVVIAAAVDPELAHGKPAELDLEILDCAGRLRDALSGSLLMFHARDTQAHPGHAALLEPGADSALFTLAQRYDIPRRRVHALDGHPAQALARLARQQVADIVVMGAVERSRLRRALIGHTAERLIDALACDVLVVKPRRFQTPVSSPRDAALIPMVRVGKRRRFSGRLGG